MADVDNAAFAASVHSAVASMNIEALWDLYNQNPLQLRSSWKSSDLDEEFCHNMIQINEQLSPRLQDKAFEFMAELGVVLTIYVHDHLAVDNGIMAHLQYIVDRVPRFPCLFFDYDTRCEQEDWGVEAPAGMAAALGQLTGLRHLDARYLHFMGSVEPLRALTQLTSLSISLGNTDHADAGTEHRRQLSAQGMEVVASLPRLEELSLEGSRITDLRPLTRLTGLKTLGLWGCPVTDLSPVTELKMLQSLGLEFVPPVVFNYIDQLHHALPLLKAVSVAEEEA